MKPSDTQRFPVGKIITTFGIKGWVKVRSDTDPHEKLFGYSPWWIGEFPTSYEITAWRPHGPGFVAHIKGFDNPEDAAMLRGLEIKIDKEHLAELTSDEYYWHQLVGLQVETMDGQVIGTVDHLFETGANDVIVVKGEKECLIPFVREQVVKDISLADNKMVVDWDPDF